MGKINLPYVKTNIVKGRAYYFYRRAGLPKPIPLPRDPTSQEFNETYKRLNASFDSPEKNIALLLPGSVAELVSFYKSAAEYKTLSDRTKDLYNFFLDDIVETFGKLPYKGMTRAVALEYRDAYADTPGKANNAIKILGRLYSFALDRNRIKINPLQNLTKLEMGSYRAWTSTEIQAFYDKAPDYIRIAVALGIYTGQRQADILKMTWTKVDGNGIRVKQQKTKVDLLIPIHWRLREVLDYTRQVQREAKVAPLTIVATRNGKPYIKRWFNEEWNRVAEAAGLPDDCVFHGLRKSAAVYLKEAGCTTEQIQSITGHKTLRMVELYTKDANQARMAADAVRKLERR